MNNHPNLKIIECNPQSHYCLVAFSSNGDGIEGKFEFENICKSNRIQRFYRKIIFIRDPSRSFYINGIDNEINDVTYLLKILKELTQDLIVRSIGYSFGGYMAILISLFMHNVDRVVAPGAVINLLDWHGSYCNYNFSDSNSVKNASKEKSYYFDLTTMLDQTNSNVFLYYAAKAKSDSLIIDGIINYTNSKYHITLFNTDKHGYYCNAFDYKYLLTISNRKIIKVSSKYNGRVISPAKYSIKLQGIAIYMINQVFRILRKIKRGFKL